MDDQLFVRIRGRVQGPFDTEKLRTLVRRGQFSRMHEVSTDGVIWQSATSFPELFASPNLRITQGASSGHEKNSSTSAPTATSSTPAEKTGRWYYAQGANEYGPVDQDVIRRLLAGGQLSPNELVWTEGMGQWAAARDVPGLMPDGVAVRAATGAASGGDRKTRQVGLEVLRELKASRPWVLFIAIYGFVLAALSAAGGLVLVIVGSREGVFPVVANGLFSIVYAGLITAGAWMLTSYAGRISRFVTQQSETRLAAALEMLRVFWIFIGIWLIVTLAFAVVIGIWVISISGTLGGDLNRLF